MRVFLSILAIFTASSVLAHDHDNPELNDWLKGLTNQINGSCCDGSDALSINDPDWDINRDAATSDDWPYKVRLENEWVLVFKNSVVKQQNKMGIARVWPYRQTDEGGNPAGPMIVRCFLPGSGA